MDDLISRQAAIDATSEIVFVEYEDGDPRKEESIILQTKAAIRDRIKALPTVQPEIIRCKDCKYWKEKPLYTYCERMYHMGFAELLDYMVEENDFCSWAVKRGDTE